MNANAIIGDDEKSLLELRETMTEQQRSDMAEIIGNELKRREAIKINANRKSNIQPSRLSGGLGADDMRDVYENADKNIQALRVKALENRVNEAKKDASRFGLVPKRQSKSFNSVIPSGNKLPVILFGIAILFFAGLKSAKLTNSNFSFSKPAAQVEARASLDTPKKPETLQEIKNTEITNEVKNEVVIDNLGIRVPSSDSERAILMQLDQRRVELERRNMVLDQKEKELIIQAKLVTEKVTELKTLINKLSALRSEKDTKYEARLDQLAAVYGAMAPNEASSLIAKLDEVVAIGLLERMPEKRMAQILGVMDQTRAIEMTRLLTNKSTL
jgi:flagellar motility protein MotE (MotC chaperone)